MHAVLKVNVEENKSTSQKKEHATGVPMRIIPLSIILLLSALSLQSHAQFRFGAHGGVVFSNIEVTNVEWSTESRLGAVAGLDAEYRFSGCFSAYFRPQYAGKGCGITAGHGDGDFSLGYIELPIGIKYTLAQGELKPYITLGAAYALNQTADFEYQGLALDWVNKVTDADIILNIGAGAECMLARGQAITLELQYSKGFSNLVDTSFMFDEPAQGIAEEAFASGIVLTVGVLFDI
jgi:hypothetical protein